MPCLACYFVSASIFETYFFAEMLTYKRDITVQLRNARNVLSIEVLWCQMYLRECLIVLERNIYKSLREISDKMPIIVYKYLDSALF